MLVSLLGRQTGNTSVSVLVKSSFDALFINVVQARLKKYLFFLMNPKQLSLQLLKMKIAKKMMEFLLVFSQDLRGQAQKGTTHMMR